MPKNIAPRAARYFQLALRYATVGPEPVVLVVMGRIATGKSSIAERLGRELGWSVFCSDRIRKTQAGLPLTKRTPPQLGPEAYSDQASEQTYRTLLQEGLAALATHSGVLLDATVSSRATREKLRHACRQASGRSRVVELEADRAAIASRLKLRAQ